MADAAGGAAGSVQNTQVFVRLRPPSAREQGARCVRLTGSKDVAFSAEAGGAHTSFAFDHVFDETVTQDGVFDACRHVVNAPLGGFNGTIMAYGQTGSGKTHTLIGDVARPELQGIVPRAVRALGEGIAADTHPGVEYEVRVSVVEIYCERIRDLLDPAPPGGAGGGAGLAIKQDAEGAIYVEGALAVPVGSEQQLVGVMAGGLAQRAVAATAVNEASSRSHCIVTVTVDATRPGGVMTSGKLCMVDLAGSERQDKTGAAGQALIEGAQINKSLSVLAKVICALTDNAASGGGAGGGGGVSGGGATGPPGGQGGGGKAAHVPYRDSKLTRMLQDSLGGSARTALIVCCSPCADNGPETLSSLRFGSRARGLKTRVTAHMRVCPEALQSQLEAAHAQVAQLQLQLEGARSAAAAAATAAATSTAKVPAPAAAPPCTQHGCSAVVSAASMAACHQSGAACVVNGHGGRRPRGWLRRQAPWLLHALSLASLLAFWVLERSLCWA